MCIHLQSKQWLNIYQHNIPTRTLHINTKIKRGVKTEKGDNLKCEDKGNNFTGTAGVHVGDTTTLEKSTASSRGVSLGAHISEATGPSSQPTHSVKTILGARPICDDLWGRTNPSGVSIVTTNSKEGMTGSHIMKEHIVKFQGSIQPELLNIISYKPYTDDLP